MGGSLDARNLCRRWIRAKEEDTATESVYRPAGHQLPPSRGRTGMEFQADGGFKEIGIGANDVSAVSEGRWTADARHGARVHVEIGNRSEEMEIISLTEDRLSLAKQR